MKAEKAGSKGCGEKKVTDAKKKGAAPREQSLSGNGLVVNDVFIFGDVGDGSRCEFIIV